MTSSIKDPIVTDAMREAGARELCQGSPLETAHDVVERVYTAMRSMEAKPDPEGDGELADDLRYIAAHTNDPRNEEIIYKAADRLDALSAKPSLEPTRTELVEFVRNFPKTKRVQRTIPAHEDLTSMGSPIVVPASTISVEVPTTLDDVADALLSRKQSGGGNG